MHQPVERGEATRGDAVPKTPSACAGSLGVNECDCKTQQHFLRERDLV